MEDQKSGSLTWIIAAIIIIGGIFFFAKTAKAPEAPKATGPVTIGFTGPLTGDLANIGQNVKAAVEIAVEEVNQAGGIEGRPLQVIYEDDQCNGTGGTNAANKLINVDKVPVILGSTCSPAMLAFAPIAEKAKVVALGYCTTAPKITDAGDYIFRDVPSDLFQADFAAKYIYGTLGKTKAAIVYLNNDWGLGLKKSFGEAFVALGGAVVLEEGYDPTSKDLRTQMAKVKSSGADILYFPGFTDGTIAGLKQAKAIGLKQTIFGADAWDDNKIWSELGAAGDGAMFTVVGTNSNDSFKAKMKEKIGSDSIIYCSNYAYDGIKIIAKVMSEVGVDSTKIKDTLYGTVYEGGVSSPKIQFDKNGDPVGASYVIKVVKGGKAEALK